MNVSMQFKLLICGVFISISSFAAVPSNSAYSTQTPQFFMNDELQDNLGMPTFLLCFMNPRKYTVLVQPAPPSDLTE